MEFLQLETMMPLAGARVNTDHKITFESIPDDHPVSRFTSYWRENRDEEGYYRRTSFSPMRLPSLIPWMIILDAPESEGGAFVYRLCGTGFTELTGIEMTGKVVGENMLPEYAEILTQELLDCIRLNEPQYSQHFIPIQGREFIHVLRGAFPIMGDTGKIDQVLVIVGKKDKKVAPLKP